jgi:hypothetical protein
MRYPGPRSMGRSSAFSAHAPSRGGISTVFLAVVAATVTGGALTWFDSGAGVGSAQKFAAFVFVFGLYFIVLCLHEFGHAFAAHRGGDGSVGCSRCGFRRST